MENRFDRSLLLIERTQLETLRGSHVMVFGLGGVGGYVCEGLARAGIGALTLVDFDTVDPTNLNRQIIALESNIGRLKTDLFVERIGAIDSSIVVRTAARRVEKDNVETFFDQPVDYVVDAIDTVSAKLALIAYCDAAGIPVISSMGTGNKLDPGRVEVADIYATHGDPMARIMRKELKKRGIKQVKVVFSSETPIRNEAEYARTENPRKPGSLVFVPAAAGITLAREVVMDILKNQLL